MDFLLGSQMHQQTFTYSGLLDHVVNIAHLEEIAYLNREAPSKGLALDVLPVSPRKVGLQTRQSSRIHEEIQASLVLKLKEMTVEQGARSDREFMRDSLRTYFSNCSLKFQ